VAQIKHNKSPQSSRCAPFGRFAAARSAPLGLAVSHMKPGRLFVVLLCYIASFYGIVLSAFMLKGDMHWALLYGYAWVAHVSLCIIWIWQMPMNWFLAITGTIAGTLSLVTMPVGIFLVFPNALLAIYIIYYYRKQKNSAEQTTNG